MNDMKKRLIDLLFEPDPNNQESDEYIEAPLENVLVSDEPSYNQQKREHAPETSTHYSAADLLYKSKQSVFVNLEETNQQSVSETINIEKTEIEEEKAEYTPTANISPMFGLINDNKPQEYYKPRLDRAQVTKPADSPLGTIFSPIYGYETSKIRDIFENKVQEEPKVDNKIENEEIENLFDEYKDYSLDKILGENVSLFDNFDSEDK